MSAINYNTSQYRIINSRHHKCNECNSYVCISLELEERSLAGTIELSYYMTMCSIRTGYIMFVERKCKSLGFLYCTSCDILGALNHYFSSYQKSLLKLLKYYTVNIRYFSKLVIFHVL